MTAAADPAVAFDAPRFPVAATIRDPRREAADAIARRRDLGYRDGYDAGMARAAVEIDAAIDDHRRNALRLGELTAAFERAIDDLARRDRVALADIEPAVVELAVALATELLGRELDSVESPVVDALNRVIELVPDRGPPTVRVHPADADTAREAVAADVVRWSDEVAVVADATVERGGCVVDVGPCRIDGQFGRAVERMRDALVSGDDLLARPADSEQSGS